MYTGAGQVDKDATLMILAPKFYIPVRILFRKEVEFGLTYKLSRALPVSPKFTFFQQKSQFFLLYFLLLFFYHCPRHSASQVNSVEQLPFIPSMGKDICPEGGTWAKCQRRHAWREGEV
jgi:hypothetical protein